jgi:hypothetical protein
MVNASVAIGDEETRTAWMIRKLEQKEKQNKLMQAHLHEVNFECLEHIKKT